MKPIFTATAILLAAGSLLAAEPPVIQVTADAPAKPAAGLPDRLRAAPGVLVNSQGGSQYDLSIRGSSFSAAGLALGGLTLRNPQTEHFHAELPVPAALLSRPAVLTGLANQGGHLTGTVNVNLLPVTGNKQIEIGFGSDERDRQDALIQQALTDRFGIGVFGGRESAEGVDYDDNDYDRERAGGHLQFRENGTQVDFLAAWQKKEFGARGYYGVSDTLPATEKTEDTLLLLNAVRGNLDTDYLRAGAAWREFNDDYQLPTLSYRNQHRSRNSTAFFDGRTLEVNGWALGWRTDVEEERIASSGSGGLGFYHRTRGGLSLLPQWRGDRLKATAGLRTEWITDESSYVLPQTGLEYLLADNLTAFASYTESVRLPSYTELSYSNLYSVGNASLRPQTERQSEIGLKGIPSEQADWKIATFHRRSENPVDWIKADPAARWTATDLGEVDAFGAEAAAGWYPSKQFDAQVAYTWIYKDSEPADYGGYASRYALDYPEHLVQASLLWRPVAPLEIGTVHVLRRQAANPVRRNGDTGVLGNVFVRITPPRIPFLTCSLEASNLWDDDFQEFPGQRPAGRALLLVFSAGF